MSAVECVLHDITGATMTLGQYLSSYQHFFHPALRKGLAALYGYAGDKGARHGKEGVQPTPGGSTVCGCDMLLYLHPSFRNQTEKLTFWGELGT